MFSIEVTLEERTQASKLKSVLNLKEKKVDIAFGKKITDELKNFKVERAPMISTLANALKQDVYQIMKERAALAEIKPEPEDTQIEAFKPKPIVPKPTDCFKGALTENEIKIIDEMIASSRSASKRTSVGHGKNKQIGNSDDIYSAETAQYAITKIIQMQEPAFEDVNKNALGLVDFAKDFVSLNNALMKLCIVKAEQLFGMADKAADIISKKAATSDAGNAVQPSPITGAKLAPAKAPPAKAPPAKVPPAKVDANKKDDKSKNVPQAMTEKELDPEQKITLEYCGKAMKFQAIHELLSSQVKQKLKEQREGLSGDYVKLATTQGEVEL